MWFDAESTRGSAFHHLFSREICPQRNPPRDLVGTSSPLDDEREVLVPERQQKELKRCLNRRHIQRTHLPDPPPGHLGTREARDRPTTIPSPCLAVPARCSAIPWGFCSGR